MSSYIIYARISRIQFSTYANARCVRLHKRSGLISLLVSLQLGLKRNIREQRHA